MKVHLVGDGGPVAILGAGRMGAAMAARLVQEGIAVTLWNRTRSTAEAVAERVGLTVAGTAEEAVASADIVISSLADDRAVDDVYPHAVNGLRPGTTVLETSTVAPQTIHRLRPAVEKRGAALLDAPVSGSVALVEKGQLTIMVGGDGAALERVRPVLAALAARIFHVGALGAGATIKLAVNSLVHSSNVALAEALVLAEKAGVARELAYEVFANSAAASPYVLYKRAAFERPDGAPVAFRLDLAVKDLRLILDLAERVGAPMDQAALNRAIASAAVAAGLGDRDLSALAVFLRSHRSR